MEKKYVEFWRFQEEIVHQFLTLRGSAYKIVFIKIQIWYYCKSVNFFQMVAEILSGKEVAQVNDNYKEM